MRIMPPPVRATISLPLHQMVFAIGCLTWVAFLLLFFYGWPPDFPLLCLVLWILCLGWYLNGLGQKQQQRKRLANRVGLISMESVLQNISLHYQIDQHLARLETLAEDSDEEDDAGDDDDNQQGEGVLR